MPFARLSWPYRQLLSARKYVVSYRIELSLWLDGKASSFGELLFAPVVPGGEMLSRNKWIKKMKRSGRQANPDSFGTWPLKASPCLWNVESTICFCSSTSFPVCQSISDAPVPTHVTTSSFSADLSLSPSIAALFLA